MSGYCDDLATIIISEVLRLDGIHLAVTNRKMGISNVAVVPFGITPAEKAAVYAQLQFDLELLRATNERVQSAELSTPAATAGSFTQLHNTPDNYTGSDTVSPAIAQPGTDWGAAD